MSVLIVIPARMKATRLPGKPLALIGGEPMIVQVWRRAMEAQLGDVVVACDGEEIASAIQAVGGNAILTNPNHPSGSDRIWEAVQKMQKTGEYKTIINLQGDVPTLEPRLLQELLIPLENPAVDISTLAAQITREEEHTNPAVVKAILSLSNNTRVGSHPEPAGQGVEALKKQSSGLFLAGTRPKGGDAGGVGGASPPSSTATGRALYFTRATAPTGDGPRYHHIGVYAYRTKALETFVSLPPSPLELREKLEQLRALEAGLRVDVRVVDTVPLGVDTPEDLERARQLIEHRHCEEP